MRVQFGRLGEFSPLSGSFVDDLFGGLLGTGLEVARDGLISMDVAESDSEMVVLAEVPGVKKDDLKVTLQEGVLTISGEKKQPGVPDEGFLHRAERKGGAFSRSLELPVAIDASAVSAELKDGILRVVVPKAEEARPHEIRVN